MGRVVLALRKRAPCHGCCSSSLVSQVSQRLSTILASERLSWIIICFGIVLRLAQYFSNRSLWYDESRLALNIIYRSFPELLQPLDYNQGAPPGFLFVEKAAVELFGNSEYALRLFPFLSGIVSLLLFHRVAKRYLKPEAIPAALGLFAISGPLIYYSSEVKQYSSDVAVALLLYWLAHRIQAKRLTFPRLALFAGVGAAAIWFSHPSVFILAGVGASLTLFSLIRQKWGHIGRLSAAYSLWVLSFLACYLVSLRSISSNEVLLGYWSGSYMPFPPSSLSDYEWFMTAFFGVFENPGGLSLSGVAALAFIVGCISMHLNKRWRFFALASPVLFALLASGVDWYPFSGRLLLFIVPSLLLLIAEGVGQVKEMTEPNWGKITIALVVLLFFHPVFYASYHLLKPRTHEEIRPVIAYLKAHHQHGDLVYLYYASEGAFRYYSERYGFEDDDYIVGIESRDDWRNYMKELDRLRGHNRVWILFSHVYKGEGASEEKLFLYYLDSLGERLDYFRATGAAVYLYDLAQSSVLPTAKASPLRLCRGPAPLRNAQ